MSSIKSSSLITASSVALLLAAGSTLWLGSTEASSQDATRENEIAAAAAEFGRTHSGAKILRSQGRITRVYGRTFGGGPTPEQAARSFVDAHSRMFGVAPANLRPESSFHDRRHTQPLMYNRQTGQYKFTLVYYTQHVNGVPVFRSDLRLLLRTQTHNPLVLAAASLRDLGTFSAAKDPTDGEDSARGRKAAEQLHPSLVNFTDPQRVIWAGVDDGLATPRVAYVFSADNSGAPNAPLPEHLLFVADAASGEILHSESLIHDVDVNGNVSGMASQGPGADFCEQEVLTPMPYARVNIGVTQAFANESGDFVVPNGGTSSVTVQSPVRGQRFIVSNAAGANTILSMSVIPPGPADFIHNAANSNELIRAEVNAYVEANVVRDWIVAANPSYPQIGSQTNFSIVVNRTDGFCPGNAWYDTSPLSINFCTSGPSNPNTAWSSVIHHEYGHHLVQAGGSGQGAYGEGTGDVLSTIILDDSRLGLGFFNSCSSSLRNADNTLQYPCSGGIHFCGQLLSGCVWDTRNELVLTEPGTYQQILMDLMVNSVLLHSGTGIAPQITTDWLTLDDDDGDLGNGTPHSNEILTGFGAHNMAPVPPPANDNCADASQVCPGTNASGTTGGASNDGSSSCGSSGSSPDAWHRYTPGSSGTATFSLCGGTNYDSVISVHTGCPGTSGNQLSCDDDFCGGGGPSQVTISVSAGIEYLVRVTGWNGSAGNYTLSITGPDCGAGCGSNAECNDGDACNGKETCVGGVCQPGTPVDCDDSDACTTDTCSGGFCSNTPINCDDSDACTIDSCAGGVCSNDPIDCDDGDACNGTETCAGGACQPGTPIDCDDSDACTADSCAGGACSYDLIACPPGEVCVGGLCEPQVCDDDGVCESGEDCNNCSGDCIGGSGGGSCGDGVCDGNSEDCFSCPADCRCAGGGGCQACCGDGVCAGPGEKAGNCPVDCGGSPPPVSFCCGDGVCEGSENEVNCEIDCGCASDTECDDGDACTTDTCVGGACENTDVPCGPNDGCCSPGCSSSNDPNCPSCSPKNAACSSNQDCCSGRCKNNGRCR